jgi:DNA-binding winged helix-turn-helix (wHTH) protein/Flp pilus assembly protein TadD
MRSPDSFAFGPFTLIPSERRLLRDGATVPLTPKAFELLVALVDARGRALSKDELIARIWPDAIVEESNLKVTMSMVRKALGDGARFIETAPRYGYRFAIADAPPAAANDTGPRSGRTMSLTLGAVTLLTIVGLGGSGSRTAHPLAIIGGGGNLAPRYTANLKAFSAYTQARTHLHRRTREHQLEAIRLFDVAIHEDPTYALAYSGLGEAYATLGTRAYIAPIEARRKMEEAARNAMRYDDTLAESHTTLGASYATFAPYRFADAERELQLAIRINPAWPGAHFCLALVYLREGRADAALPEMQQARALDPLSAIVARQMSLPFQFKHEYARALQFLREADPLGPRFSTGQEVEIYVQNGLHEEALAYLDHAAVERKDDPIVIYSRGFVYAAQGQREGARQAIATLEILGGTDLATAQLLAKLHAALNERDASLTWLERGLDTGALGTFYKEEPVWDPLRADPRFAALLMRAGYRPTQ